MKKFLAIVLALTFVLSFGAISFAAADEVAGTLADGTAVTKPVSEVVKSVEDGLAALDAEKAETLKTFFAEAEAKEDVTVIAKGIVDFAGAFADATEAEIEVPLAAPGVKAGDKVGVSLSTGTSKTVEAAEDDVVTVAFPKDADGVGYVISSAKEKATWDWPLPPEKAPGKSWDNVRTEETPYGPVTVYENYDADGNVIESETTGTLTYEDGSTDTFTDTYTKNEDGSETRTSEGTYTDASGYTVDYSSSSTQNPDGSSTSESTNNVTNADGTTEQHHTTSTTNADGSGTQETTSSGTVPEEHGGGTYTSHQTVTNNADGSSVEEYTSTTTDANGNTYNYSSTTTTNPDGSYTTTETYPDGHTETHSYDADGNEITPSDSPKVEDGGTDAPNG